ncbi:MAG: hypothetical protein RLZZ519_2155 [Bacteroidota bacterium]|jgi:hypothetical protein
MNLTRFLLFVACLPCTLLAQEAGFNKQRQHDDNSQSNLNRSTGTTDVAQILKRSPEFAAMQSRLEIVKEDVSQQVSQCASAGSVKEKEACSKKLIEIKQLRDSLESKTNQLEVAVENAFGRFENATERSLRSSKANVEFENGRLQAANAALDVREILREAEALLVTRQKSSTNQIDSLLRMKASELITKAFLKATDFSDPHRKDSVLFCADKAFSYAATAHNAISIGYLLSATGHLKQAILYTEKGLLLKPTPEEQIAIWQNLYYFHAEAGQIKEAESALLKAAALIEPYSKTNSNSALKSLGGIQYLLGRFYFQQKRFEDAAQKLIQAKSAYRQLVENSPSDKAGLASITLELADVYLAAPKLGSAEKELLEGLEIQKQLARVNADEEPYLGRTFLRLGIYCYEVFRNREAVDYLQKAFDIFEQHATMDPGRFEGSFNKAQSYLPTVYIRLGNLSEAEQICMRTIKVYDALVKSGRDEEQLGLACGLLNLGTVLWNQGNLLDAESNYTRSLEVHAQLEIIYPKRYRWEHADALERGARLASAMGKNGKSDSLFLRSLALQEELEKEQPGVYSLDLANTLMYQGLMFQNTDRLQEAEQVLTRSVKINEAAWKAKPENSEEDLAYVLGILADCKLEMDKAAESEKLRERTFAIYERLAQQYPDVYEPRLANQAMSLGSVYKLTGKHKASGQIILRGLEIRKRLARENPEAHGTDLALAYNMYGLHLGSIAEFAKAREQFLIAIDMLKRRILAGDKNDFEYFTYPYLNLNDIRDSFALQHAWPTVVDIQKERLEAATAISGLVPKGDSLKADALGAYAWYILFVQKYEDAKKMAAEAIGLDGTQNWIRTNLGHAYLLTADWENAIKTYREYMEMAENKDYARKALGDDWNLLEKEKVVSADNLQAINRAREWLQAYKQ